MRRVDVEVFHRRHQKQLGRRKSSGEARSGQILRLRLRLDDLVLLEVILAIDVDDRSGDRLRRVRARHLRRIIVDAAGSARLVLLSQLDFPFLNLADLVLNSYQTNVRWNL